MPRRETERVCRRSRVIQDRRQTRPFSRRAIAEPEPHQSRVNVRYRRCDRARGRASRVSAIALTRDGGFQFLVLSTSAPFLIHGIMSRSLTPTSSIGWAASLARVALNEVWLTLFY